MLISRIGTLTVDRLLSLSDRDRGKRTCLSQPHAPRGVQLSALKEIFPDAPHDDLLVSRELEGQDGTITSGDVVLFRKGEKHFVGKLFLSVAVGRDIYAIVNVWLPAPLSGPSSASMKRYYVADTPECVESDSLMCSLIARPSGDGSECAILLNPEYRPVLT